MSQSRAKSLKDSSMRRYPRMLNGVEIIVGDARPPGSGTVLFFGHLLTSEEAAAADAADKARRRRPIRSAHRTTTRLERHARRCKDDSSGYATEVKKKGEGRVRRLGVVLDNARPRLNQMGHRKRGRCEEDSQLFAFRLHGVIVLDCALRTRAAGDSNDEVAAALKKPRRLVRRP